MKYKRPETAVFAMITIINSIFVITGLIMVFTKTELSMFFMAFGIPFSILFLAAFIASSRSYIYIDDEKISFPVTRSPKLKFKRNQVFFSDIEYVTIRRVKGDGIFSKDTSFYCFRLKTEASSFEETLFPYGKKQEQAIVSAIKEKVKVIQ